MSIIETRQLLHHEPPIFEKGAPGRTGASLPKMDVPDRDPAKDWGPELRRQTAPALPEVSEVEATRHYTRLSRWNYAIDLGMYPLGSCTMKYNPKINEQAARLPGFAALHPYQPESTLGGALALMHALERELCEITGMVRATLQPAAGAHGELCGVMLIRAALADKGRKASTILIPDSAHGTNPATCTLNGFRTVSIPTTENGIVDVASVEAAIAERPDDIAGIMLTNPSTLGLFEENVARIAELVHAAGGYVYMDGANLNALMGKFRPGDHGVDVMHINLHKTFTTPHGGGGPGSGPVAVSPALEPYLPTPLVTKDGGKLRFDWNRPKSIGRLRSFYGNWGMHVRAYTYIREMGGSGLTRATELAVLNANYLRARLGEAYPVAYPRPSMHEVVLSDKRLKKETGVTTLDVAKRLIDHGYHPPTVYFPLVISGAIMIEPTETESLEELDQFADAMIAIAKEAHEDPDKVKTAPHQTGLRRLDETRAARQLKLRWGKTR